MATFLMITHGTAGDVLPFIRVGATLVEQGHRVTLCTHAPFAETAGRAGLSFAAVDTTESYLDGLSYSNELLNVRGPADLRRYYERCGLFDQIRREVDLLRSRHHPGQTVLVGRHTSALSVLIAADLLDAPAAWVAVAPVQLVVAPVAEAHTARGLAAPLNRIRTGLGCAPVADWRGWLRSAQRTIGLWPQWYERAGVSTGAELAGFVTGDELAGFGGGADVVGGAPAAAAGLLATDPAPVLVTGGTGRLLHERFYAVALEAVTRTGRTGLVVTPDRALLPDPLPAGLHWFPRLPFAAVFPRAAAVLHHGGIGTAVRALRSGTPQVIMAHGADRPDNAERLAAAGLARWTAEDRWSAQAVAAQLGEAVADRGYGERAARIAGGPGTAGPTRAAELLEQLASGQAPAGVYRDGAGRVSRRLRDLSPEQRARLLRRLRRDSELPPDP